MTRNILIALLRNDLRLHDHPILHVCSEPTPSTANFTQPITHVLPVYVFDQRHVEVSGFPRLEKARKDGGGKGSGEYAKTRELGLWRTGIHRIKFINESVFDLRDRLRRLGSDLAMFAGTPESVIASLIHQIRAHGDTVEAVYLSREINTEEVNIQKRLQRMLSDVQCRMHMFETKSLIHSRDLGFPVSKLPDVFTHFRKQVERNRIWRAPLASPDRLKPFAEVPVEDAAGVYSLSANKQHGLDRKNAVEKCLLQPLLDNPVLAHNELLARVMCKRGQVDVAHSAFPYRGGETEALARLDHYFDRSDSCPAASYKQTRNQMLGTDYSTKFGAALALGLLSPRLIAQKATELDNATHDATHNASNKGGGYWIIFELLWRDYFYFVGWKFGSKLFSLRGIEDDISARSAPSKASEWKSSASLSDRDDGFVRWCTAQTGVPLIDANMVEMVQTGFMSNRGRQNVASFLTKDLGWNWRHGAEFFESWLVDYEPNSNWGNWQYVAGVGNDPRSSRQFNPIKQGNDYDANGEYVATWLPLLSDTPPQYRHHPWTCPDAAWAEQAHNAHYPVTPIVEQQMWRKHYSNPEGAPPAHHKPDHVATGRRSANANANANRRGARRRSRSTRASTQQS